MRLTVPGEEKQSPKEMKILTGMNDKGAFGGPRIARPACAAILPL